MLIVPVPSWRRMSCNVAAIVLASQTLAYVCSPMRSTMYRSTTFDTSVVDPLSSLPLVPTCSRRMAKNSPAVNEGMSAMDEDVMALAPTQLAAAMYEPVVVCGISPLAR